MSNDNKVFTVIVNKGTSHRFYGTFNDRQIMLNSIKENLNLKDTYIQGSSKKLNVTVITLFNGFIGNGLTIYKEDENGNSNWYIKILKHQLNEINPYFLETRDEQEKQSRIF